MSTNIEQRVIKVIAEQMGMTNPETIKLDETIFGSLGMDSLDAIETVMFIEDEFEIEIADEEAEKLATVGDLVKLVTSKVGDGVAA